MIFILTAIGVIIVGTIAIYVITGYRNNIYLKKWAKEYKEREKFKRINGIKP